MESGAYDEKVRKTHCPALRAALDVIGVKVLGTKNSITASIAAYTLCLT